ncbi:SMI1/KNR4 family protein [Candidatus Pantoea multigeneris]|uniref:SMI1/KNR4 family protein n=1 Tax=Candidatus Pantoea multigeneris TaxID=2608357 RepID=A0ABX0RGF1_9GAMM|nr:SMI1/KNR4 family protein [Pantoea multigeneris]NIF24411.1 SMI1/KNR4 family protein [Pantoea multigeneris]
MAILTGVSISQIDIDLLAKRLSVVFPDDYKNFLSNYNGFRVSSPDHCDIPYNNVDNNFISFDALFGHKVNNDNYDIESVNDDVIDELSFISNAVVIGIDPGDNFYVLVTEGEKSGVYYWDRACLHADDKKNNYSISGEDGYLHLYFYAKTFKQFFDLLIGQTIKKGMTVSSGL